VLGLGHELVGLHHGQVGEASAATDRAEDLRAANAALRMEVEGLQRDLSHVQDPRFIKLAGRAFGLGGPGEVPFALDMCSTGTAMWSEENGAFKLVFILDEDGNNDLDEATSNEGARIASTVGPKELAKIVDRAGHPVDTARDGAEAIEKLARNRYAVMVLDLMMPNVDGYGLIEHMRARGGHRPAIIVISAGDTAALRRLDGSVVHSILRKPFDIDVLGDLISAATKSM
jgi:CheY-like chemotaxis protein